MVEWRMYEGEGGEERRIGTVDISGKIGNLSNLSNLSNFYQPHPSIHPPNMDEKCECGKTAP